MSIQIWATGQLDYLYLSSVIDSDRLGAEITGNANIFSALFMYAGVFAAWQALYTDSKKSSLMYLGILAIILLVMVISGGRKTTVAVIACLFLFLLFKRDAFNRHKFMRNVILALCSIFIIFYAIFNIPLLYDLIGKRFEGLFSLLTGNAAQVSGDDMRRRMITMAYEGWLQSPFFGHGIDSFKAYNLATTGHHYYAHNNYLELLYDVGIIGFAIYYWIYFYIIKNLAKLPESLYKYKILGFGLLLELMIFDFGGVSYYLVGSVNLLAISFLCSNLKPPKYERIN
ncbi:MAG: O-antigen ligase family protein [Muribaculum sp.]|nr:O-antigen ligase family protein [Muribaculum sp.]